MALDTGNLCILTGNANPDLAKKIADHIGVNLCDAYVGHFNNGETQVMISESIRGKDIFIIQPTSYPVNDNLMELLIMADACKRASAHSITAVVPYYAYARQDRKTRGREPISAKLVANLMTTAGVTRVVTVDLHAGQIQGFFDIPVDHLAAAPVIANYFRAQKFDDVVVVSPDLGGVTRARILADHLQAPIAIIEKRRPKPGCAEVMNLIGDVEGKDCILFDDMVDTAGSLCNAAKAIVEVGGANKVYACASHGVLSGPAIDRLESSNIEELALLDTIPAHPEAVRARIKYLSVAPMFGEAIERIYQEISIAKLFN